MKLTDKFLRTQLELVKPLTDVISLEAVRGLQDKLGKLMHFTRRREVVSFDKSSETMKGDLIVPRDELRGGLILYLHGGGYVCSAKAFGN